jgi:hypothetical protein
MLKHQREMFELTEQPAAAFRRRSGKWARPVVRAVLPGKIFSIIRVL